MSDAVLPKEIFNAHLIDEMRAVMSSVDERFDGEGFSSCAKASLETMELKARSAHIADCLYRAMQGPLSKRFKQLLNAMEKLQFSGGKPGWDGFHYLPFLDVVERHGLDEPALSVPLLGEMTCYFSAEFAIRPYILQHRELTFEHIERWAQDSAWERRRLASEGTRPRLPWGMRLNPLIDDPSPVIAILDRLHGDENEIVRRSAANNLNDIAKDHPDLAAETAVRWHQTGNAGSQHAARHAMRTLIKNGHPTALGMLGFVGGNNVDIDDFRIEPEEPAIGSKALFSFTLRSNETQKVKLAVDYALDRTLANGKQARKVFKLAIVELEPGSTKRIEKVHDFQQRSTRTYYSGPHAIAITVNGMEQAKLEFDLRAPS